LTPLTLSDDERLTLEAWTGRPKTTQRLALRSRIVLAAAAGRSNTPIAADLRVTLPTVGTWRQRFLDARLEGLADEPRPGAPRTLTDARGGVVRHKDRGVRAGPGRRPCRRGCGSVRSTGRRREGT
jgi:hypothetical protein